MVDFDFKEECYQCEACGSVCPVMAITFSDCLMPIVDKNVCVKCGKCNRICPRYQEKPYIKDMDYADGYVCKNLDLKMRKISSSGAVFVELTKFALEHGWYVAGVIYDSNFMPKHIISNRQADVLKMLGSKYVTSDMGNTISEINALRNQKKRVMFSGTPCQVSAVRNAFPHDEGIFTISIACHGTIDRDIWRSFLEAEEKMHGKISSITMRDKSKGWLNYGLRFTYADGSENVTFRKETGYFLQCYTSGLMERDRCLKCNYKGTKIMADILLADAWGMEEKFPEMSDEWGMSSVLCLTEKGKAVFENIKEKFDVRNVAVEEITTRNQRIISPAPKNPSREKFAHEFRKNPVNIQKLCEKYARPTLFQKVRRKIKSLFNI